MPPRMGETRWLGGPWRSRPWQQVGLLGMALGLMACPVGEPMRSSRSSPIMRGSAASSSEPGASLFEEGLRHESHTLDGGLACLIQLRETGVEHRHLEELEGVQTPVEVTGPVGGLRFKTLGRQPLRCDCRLVLALLRAAPYLTALGVSELHFSSAYRKNRKKSGRPSRHSLGLAIDVHRFTVDGEVLRVDQDYVKGQGEACQEGAPPLNRIACVLSRLGLFDVVLTPDYDAAHANHFHLDILGLYRRRATPSYMAPDPE